MTNWMPDLEGRPGPRYIAIADALAADVTGGRFRHGDRLPPHRDLAWRLGVTVGTVSRAYAEAERRGLIVGEVGRGTYIRAMTPDDQGFMPTVGEDDGAGLIDLTFNFPPPAVEDNTLAAALRELADDARGSTWLHYQPCAGRRAHREAAATWLGLSSLTMDPERIAVSAGAQHGVLVALAALTRPGDRVATEAFTYPGIKLVARLLGLRLEGIAMDGEGVLPEALEAACRSGDIKALYCIPTLQNPTSVTMTEARRRAIAEVARRHGVAIVEDDIMRLLVETAPAPIAAFAPELTYHVTSLSKTVAPGLRIGFVAGPEGSAERLAAAVRATCWMTPPLSVEIGARWIADGTALRILGTRRREVAARRARVVAALGARAAACPEGSLHLWLHLPEPWRASDLALEARTHGVAITPAEAFAVSRRDATHAVRVCFGAAPDLATLDRAMGILAELLDGEPSQALGTMV